MSVSRETSCLDVSRETRAKLNAFQRLLSLWNAKINLVSAGDLPLIWGRHIDDALQLARFIPAGTPTLLDIGSGAGFPGLVLALATNCKTTLVEADARKCAFLREAVRETGASANVVCGRIEAAALPLFPVITARAVAPLRKLLEWATPHLAPEGMLMFPKGSMVDREISDAESDWVMNIQRHPSRTHSSGVILCITEARRGS